MSEPKSHMTLAQAEARVDECELYFIQAKSLGPSYQPWVQSYRSRLLSLKELVRRKRAEERKREDWA